jgi:hypothetical protein
MLNMSGLYLAPATAPRLSPERPWEDPDDEAPGGSHVWMPRSAWADIVQGAPGLGPLTLRSGDGLCRIRRRAHLRQARALGAPRRLKTAALNEVLPPHAGEALAQPLAGDALLEMRLLTAPLHAPARPQACTWRVAVNAICGGPRGSAC